MSENEILPGIIIAIVDYYAANALFNQTINIDVVTNAEIENGESIIGYQYLHGTNADVGGFHVIGTITKDTSGYVYYDLTCTWNDMIDPNYKYQSDKKKATVAKLIPFANPTDYFISITWNVSGKTSCNYYGGSCGKRVNATK